MSQNASQKQVIREQMRARRRALGIAEREAAAAKLAAMVGTLAEYRAAKQVACYLDFDGEMPTRPLVEQIMRDKGHCWLPKILQLKPPVMQFLPLSAWDRLSVNRLGIAEVDAPEAQAAAPSELDLVLLPLVAVDRQGFRLGMGGGFYDSYFAQTDSRLVGVGFDFQMLDELPRDHWDVPLLAYVSERQVYRF